MAGTSKLVCNGFIDGTGFIRSKEALKERTGLTDRQIDDRMEAAVWALHHSPDEVATKVPNRNLWTVPVPESDPPLRLYLRPSPEHQDQAEWMWIEERFD